MDITAIILIAVLVLLNAILLFHVFKTRRNLQESQLQNETSAASHLEEMEDAKNEVAAVKSHYDFLEMLIACERLINHSSDAGIMCKELCEKLCETELFDVAWIGFAKEDADELPVSYFCDQAEPRFLFNEFKTPLNPQDIYANGPSSQAMLSGERVLIEDALSDARFALWRSRAKFSAIVSVIALPFKQRKGYKPLGVLTLYAKKTIEESSPYISHLETLVQSATQRMIEHGNEARNNKEAEFYTRRAHIFQQVLDTVPANIYWKDSQLRYLGCNRTYLGYRNVEHFNALLGKTDQELGWIEAESPQTAEEVKIITKDETVSNRVERDGDKWILANKKPFSDSLNDTRGLVCVHIDITAQHSRVVDLERHEKHFRELIDNLPGVALQGFDESRRITSWNAQSSAMFGYTKQEALGTKIDELLYAKADRNPYIAKIDRWLTQNKPIMPAYAQLTCKDGSSLDVHVSHILIDRRGDHPEFFCVSVKI